MTDKVTSPEDDKIQDEPQENLEDDSGEDHQQKMFEQTFSRLMDEFGKACEKEGVEAAIAIAKHPDFEQPIVFFRAPHIVEAGALMAGVLREIKTDLNNSLDTEPQ